MTKARIIVKIDGKMGFSEVEVEEGADLPAVLTTTDGTKFELADWCGQFNGPSIPVYEKVPE